MSAQKDIVERPRMPRRGRSLLLDAKESAAEHGWTDEAVAAVHAARDAGWTLQEIGDVIGVTREFIRQLYNREVDPAAEVAGFPERPPRPKKHKPTPKHILWRQLVSDEEIAELAELAKVSKWRRAGGDPEIAAAAEDFWGRVNHLVTIGVPHTSLSKLIGLSAATVRMGLGRYGYRPAPPSQRQRHRTGTVGHYSGRSNPAITEFATFLKANPGTWAAYPNDLKKRSLQNLSLWINRNHQRAPMMLRNGFQAEFHDGKLQVRYVGDEAVPA